MDESAFMIASAIWGLASAIAVVAIGVLSLLGGRSRPRGAFAFGLFALAWGLQVTVGNWSALAQHAPYVVTLYLLTVVLLLPQPYFLIEFAASHAPSGRTAPLWRVLRLAAAALAVAGALALLLAPELLVRFVTASDGTVQRVWGPLQAPLITLPEFGAFAVALLALAASVRKAATERVAERASFLLVGLGLYVGFAAGYNATFYGAQLLAYGQLDKLGFFLVFLGLCAVVLGIVGATLRDARYARAAREARRRRVVATLIAVAFGWGLLEPFLSLGTTSQPFQSVGLWRLAGMGVIAYGIARWRIYDLPQRATRITANATGATAAAAGAAAAYGATTFATEGGSVVPALAGLVVLAAVIAPSLRFARRLFGVPATRENEAARDEALYGQRIDSYRAALEASLARGTLDEDAAFLAALRERFDITPAEERVLMHYARASVIVPRMTGGERTPHPFDTYERLRLLGEGGGGRTWLARDRARDRLVVLKEPLDRHQHDPLTRENVLREARLAARIRHANVVSVIEVVETKGVPVIVMEYLEGGSLADLLRSRGGAIPWPDAVQVVEGVLRGLEAVHSAGIIHRDIKPSNVLLTADGVPKLADFGVALPLSSGHTLVETSTTFAGTISYVAPEVRAGALPGDRRSDVYSAAALLHELVHGVPPGKKDVVIVDGALPPALAKVLARGLAERPEERYPTARAFAEELQRLGRLP